IPAAAWRRSTSRRAWIGEAASSARAAKWPTSKATAPGPSKRASREALLIYRDIAWRFLCRGGRVWSAEELPMQSLSRPLLRRRGKRVPRLDRPFVAIDFETADRLPDCACAVALVRVEDGEIRERFESKIRPPRRQMLFTHIHGLRWEDV